MELGKILFSRLSSDAGVSAIAESRIFPQSIPLETDKPAVAYDFNLNDPYDGSAPILSANVTVGCWGRTNDVAHNLGRAVLEALDSYSGQSGGTRLAPLTFAGQSESQDFDVGAWGVILTFQGLVVVS